MSSVRRFYCNDTINDNLCLCKNSPRFHQIVSNKRSKIKTSWQSTPPDPPPPPVFHMLCTWIHTCPPHPTQLEQIAERNPGCSNPLGNNPYTHLHTCSEILLPTPACVHAEDNYKKTHYWPTIQIRPATECLCLDKYQVSSAVHVRVASSPGPTRKIGKKGLVTLPRMCWVSILCNSHVSYTSCGSQIQMTIVIQSRWTDLVVDRLQANLHVVRQE